MAIGQTPAAGLSRRRGVAILLAGVILASAVTVSLAPVRGTAETRAVTPGQTTIPKVEFPSSPLQGGESRVQGNSADLAASSAFSESVVRTVFPGFNTSLRGSFTSSVSAWEVGSPAYVPSTDTIWFPQRSISIPGVPFPTVAPAAVFNLATKSFDRLVTNLSNASALAYDPGNGFLYATVPATNSVAVINPVSGVIVKSSIPVGSDPDAIAIDPGSNSVFVANYGSSNVTVINAGDNQVLVPSVTVGTEPSSLVDDSHDGLIFVANAGSKFVSVITAANPTFPVTEVPLFWGPASGIAYSPQSGNVIATIPSSGYATIIHAPLPQAVVTSVGVGTGVIATATSENGTEFVLGNSSGGDVVVLNSSVGTQIGSAIGVDRNATQLVLDPQSGIMDCWTSNARVLESVNLSSDTAAPVTPTTDPQLVSIGALQGQPRVFASAGNESLVYPLGSLSLELASAAMSTSSPALSVVANSMSNRLYIGTAAGLDIYDAASDQLINTVAGLSGEDSQLVLDQPDNLLWLVDSLSGVTAVNLATSQVLFSTGLSPFSGAKEAVAVDPSLFEAFVLVSSKTLAVLNSLTGHVVDPSITVGSNVTALAYDPTDGQVYAAGDEVSLLNASSLTVDGGPILLGASHKVLGEVYEPSREAILIATVGLLPGQQGAVTVLDGTSISASEGSVDEIPVGVGPDALGVVTSATTPLTGSAMVWVANELSGTISVISSPPQITSIAASPSTLDLGYPTSVIVTYEGGAGSSTVTYFGLPSGCASSDEFRLNCTPTAPGVFSVAANVTDSFGYSANATTTLTVLHSLGVRSVFPLSTFPFIDPGVSLLGTASASNGSPPYSYQWSFGDGTSGSGPSVSHAYLHSGSYVVTVAAKDSTGASNSSSTAVIVVPSPSVAVSLRPGNVTDVDVPLLLQAAVSGGAGEAQQGWTFGDGSSSGLLNASHIWTRPGNFSATFAYTDALGAKANGSVEVTVHPSLSATFSTGSASAASPAFPATLVSFTSRISGGTPPYAVAWAFGDGSFATGLSVTHRYASVGTYSVNVTLTDEVGATVRTNLSVAVSPNLSSAGGLSPLTGGFGSGLFLGLLLGGVIAAAVLYVVSSRKGARPPSGPVSPYVPP